MHQEILLRSFKYHKTNCFFIKSSISDDLLAFDAGWPCTFFEYQRCMKTIGFRFSNVKIAIVSHFHMDHAGLIGEFIQANVECFTFPGQAETIDHMERTILKAPEYSSYERIEKSRLTEVLYDDFNVLIDSNGFGAKVIHTPGHSQDSVSLITADHDVLIGDLCPIGQFMDDDIASRTSWERIVNDGGRRILPSHAEAFEI